MSYPSFRRFLGAIQEVRNSAAGRFSSVEPGERPTVDRLIQLSFHDLLELRFFELGHVSLHGPSGGQWQILI